MIGEEKVYITRIRIHNFRTILDQEISVQKFSLLIGPNNAGKSTILNAIRLFYGDINWSKEDFPKAETLDDDVWVEIEFELDDTEWANLADNYKDNDSNRLILRRLFKSETIEVGRNLSNLYVVLNGELSESCFYGVGNVGLNKLGDLLYIPAMSSASDQTKMSGPSPLRDMINYLLKKVVVNSESYQSILNAFSSLNIEAKDKDGFLSQISTPLNKSLESWGVALDLSLASIRPEDISKSLIKHAFLDSSLGNEDVHIDKYGHGFQRAVIYELMSLATGFKEESKTAKKEFSPSFNLILFEEPESFLHPNQQENMAYRLRELSKSDGQQIIITSHAPTFLDKAHENLLEIVRVRRVKGITHINQLTKVQLKDIFEKGIELETLFQDIVTKHEQGSKVAKNFLNDEDLSTSQLIDREKFKYQLWLGSERLSLFFSDIVILVEGATEKVFLEYQLARDWANLREYKVCIIDVNGKFNFHRYMKLLESYGIRHIIICDADSNKGYHGRLNSFIVNCCNEFTLDEPHFFEEDFEHFLGYEPPPPTRREIKPILAIQKLESKEICSSKMDELYQILATRLEKSL